MARVKTFTNGGSLLPGDLNSIEDDYEFAFSTYKDIADFGWIHLDAPATGVYLWGKNGNPIGSTLPQPAYQLALFYFDPAYYLANARTTKLRVRLEAIGNAVGSGQSGLIATLAAVSTWGGASGATPTVTAIGANVGNGGQVGSTSSTPQQAVSTDFSAPSAQWLVMTVNVVGSFVAGAYASARATLQMRQV
jgi:hypothetical protein